MLWSLVRSGLVSGFWGAGREGDGEREVAKMSSKSSRDLVFSGVSVAIFGV